MVALCRASARACHSAKEAAHTQTNARRGAFVMFICTFLSTSTSRVSSGSFTMRPLAPQAPLQSKTRHYVNVSYRNCACALPRASARSRSDAEPYHSSFFFRERPPLADRIRRTFERETTPHLNQALTGHNSHSFALFIA